MSTNKIGEMSLQELMALIDARIKRYQSTAEPKPYKTGSSRSMTAILTSMRHNLWTPPDDAPSTTELLREDRDR